MHMPEFIVWLVTVLVVGLIFVSMFFFLYKASLDNNDIQKACISNGGSWVISEKTQGNHPDYECNRS